MFYFGIAVSLSNKNCFLHLSVYLFKVLYAESTSLLRTRTVFAKNIACLCFDIFLLTKVKTKVASLSCVVTEVFESMVCLKLSKRIVNVDYFEPNLYYTTGQKESWNCVIYTTIITEKVTNP